jgi:transposase
MIQEKTLDMKKFYPENLEIIKVTESENQITIKMKSNNRSFKCQKCGNETEKYHGTYERRGQDLPILGKNVELKIISYEYYCSNAECVQKIFIEEYDGFLSKYDRMTSRCEDLIRLLGMETSCEGAAKICRAMGIKVSGDTIIRLIKSYASEVGEQPCGTTIGVDDFAYRKGKTYCTVVCDEASRKPIAVLEGRDGEKLSEWLKGNKQVTKVTRDRASAYAKVISDILPEAMQIADRFHLHQNLLDAVKEALKTAIPNEIPIPNDYGVSLESNEIQENENTISAKTIENSTDKKK